jgi:phospholipid/cholesterol/gamma-HCH transport system ATP-binding protein
MGMIEVRDVVKSFDGYTVLNGVDLSVEKGTTTVILGKSGTGKSVLLKSIIGLMTPDSGSITVDGEEIMGLPAGRLDALRRRMGYLFQGAALYDSMTVRDNLALTLERNRPVSREERDERILESLRMVGLENAIGKMPAELSGGMKKRIGLARSLITNPEIMLYDEPTTGLDPITGREISNLIDGLQEQFHATAIAVTHDMACARIIADRVAILDDGTIIREGTLESLERTGGELVESFFQTS